MHCKRPVVLQLATLLNAKHPSVLLLDVYDPSA